MVALVFISVCTPHLLQICFRRGRNFTAPEDANTTLKTLVEGTSEDVKEVLEEERNISSSLAQLQKLNLPSEKRRKINRKIVICLAAGQARAFAKLKKLARADTAGRIVEDLNYPTCKARLEDFIEAQKQKYDRSSCKERLDDFIEAQKQKYDRSCCKERFEVFIENQKQKYERWCCKPQPESDGPFGKLLRWLKMAVPFVDVVRDLTLVAILIAMTGQSINLDDITLFPNVVILILLGTVLVPLFLSALQTSYKHPLTIFEFSVWNSYKKNPAGKWELRFLRTLVFSFYLLVPAILVNNKEKAKHRRQSLEEQGKKEYLKEGTVNNSILEEQEAIEIYLEEVSQAQLIFKRDQLGMEVWIQKSIQLMMLLLGNTSYPVASGLQGIFNKDFPIFNSSNVESYLPQDFYDIQDFFASLRANVDKDLMLTLSISWSFMTGIVTFIRIYSEQKGGMMSLSAKMTLGLRALFFFVTRISCIVAFFGPFLGLFNIMSHWHAEGLQLEKKTLSNLHSKGSFWTNETVRLMFREQNYTNYTIVTLQKAFFLFLGLLLLHGVAIFILKKKVSEHFKLSSFPKKIGHVVQSLHVPDVYKDFDVDLSPERDPIEFQLSYNSVKKETFWMSFLQMVSNLLLLVPLVITGEIEASLLCITFIFYSL